VNIKIFVGKLDARFTWKIDVDGQLSSGIADREGSAKRAMLEEIERRMAKLSFEPLSFDPKTSDYCKVCGESPESGSHIFDHEYIFDPNPVPRSERQRA
jgi:hypothetical protein